MKKKGIILIIIVILAIVGGLELLYRNNVIPHNKYTNEDFGINQYQSEIDLDQDGIDDQTDILQSAFSYVMTKPKYKSKYYETGYPNDGFGVCTDVVAFALKDAGYDLQYLVNEDIKMNPQDYNIKTPDVNIDFRRVRNLNQYFSNHAISLTLDINQNSEWSGGDIVVFKGHIGIVSSNRNNQGVPFVIHHNSQFQFHYEEDILMYRHDIIGHYRIS
ncbi:DUF1287 domain-containing protein [Anaerorhabdus sp.]|uniref:DUF1287 domain-containing protein n=1 Tax=Anaerorhabdus sp. TaxID=1872524 RepID=UPI002FC7623B